ncbi:AraC-like DNA-binding protein [Sporomusaceae bacterium BoRhaA]|uniref:AraC family transcriptional regulator n=1 Tax=Pelorhabdus rhamnosifermentans TaxID=2772457 RepID=UPI001C062853|nr:AraC family transcriptional regulator [Pelorhabdus rhamnosifermentans]MBU2702951.1 AraC-like DNA-binding protein [Pelorhabdus rhamnosifermentans]
MEQFIYKKWDGITALSASFTDFAYKKHCHEEYAFGVTLSGVQQYHLDGSLELSYPHGVMLFNSEQTHDGMAQDKTGLKYVMLYVEPDFFMELLGRKEFVRFSSPVVYDYRLEQSILSLSNAILSASDESLCSELFVSFANNFTEVGLNTAYKKEDAHTQIAKEMIYYSLENVLKLDDICKELNISKFKFIRSFKANTGLSPYQYFLNCKVSLAKRLIEKNRDIYSAVTDCGFVDITHLNRNFKKIYGTTAYEYLKLI